MIDFIEKFWETIERIAWLVIGMVLGGGVMWIIMMYLFAWKK